MSNPKRFGKYLSHGNAVYHDPYNPNPVHVKSNRHCALLVMVLVAGSLGLTAATFINGGF